MAEPSILPAAIGLVGVLIGSAISTGANWLLAVRKERADAKKAEEERRYKVVSAARLVEGELAWAKALLEGVLKQGLKRANAIPLATTSWAAQKDLLAANMKRVEWHTVSSGMLAVVALVSYWDQDWTTWLTQESKREGSTVLLERIEAALEALKPYTN